MVKIAYQVYTFHRGHSVVVSAVQPWRSKCTENGHCTTGEVSHTPKLYGVGTLQCMGHWAVESGAVSWLDMV